MAKRDHKGRFLKRRRGMGTIITMRRGMGALPGGALGEAVIPPAVGGLTTALVVLAIRNFANPNLGDTQRMMVRWAWLLGGGAGVAASLLLMLVGGTKAALGSAVSTAVVSAGFLGQDMLLMRNAGSTVAALSPAGPAAGAAGYGARRGIRAIVPEYGGVRGLGAMVMEPVGANGRRAGTLGSPYGQNVALHGINTGAFGTKAFG